MNRFKKCICRQLVSLCTDNINCIRSTVTIHSSGRNTVRHAIKIQHKTEILLLLDLFVAFPFLSQLIKASEKKDNNEKKGGGLGGWAASCCLATYLKGDLCGYQCVREQLYRLMSEQVGERFFVYP